MSLTPKLKLNKTLEKSLGYLRLQEECKVQFLKAQKLKLGSIGWD